MMIDIVFASSLKISKKLLFYLLPAIIFILYVILNSLINVQFYGSYFNHVISYISSVLLFLIMPLWYYESFKLKYNYRQLLFWICFVTVFTCLYAISQFFLNNFFGINLDDYLYWPAVEISNTMALGMYFRTKSFFAEPGHFGLFLECFIPLIFWYFYKTKIIFNYMIKNILFFIIIIAFVLTISAASFFCLSTAFLIVWLINVKDIKNYSPKFLFKVMFFLGILYLIYFYTNSYFSVFDMIYTNSIDKLDSGSSQDRLSRLGIFFDIVNNMNVLDYFLGFGPNATVTLGYRSTVILLYPLVFIELGLLGFLFFAAILCGFIYYSFSLKGSIRFYTQVSLFSVLLHYLFISNYWYPYLWFLGVFIYLYNKLQPTIDS
jgi:hypothetical protein